MHSAVRLLITILFISLMFNVAQYVGNVAELREKRRLHLIIDEREAKKSECDDAMLRCQGEWAEGRRLLDWCVSRCR